MTAPDDPETDFTFFPNVVSTFVSTFPDAIGPSVLGWYVVVVTVPSIRLKSFLERLALVSTFTPPGATLTVFAFLYAVDVVFRRTEPKLTE